METVSTPCLVNELLLEWMYSTLCFYATFFLYSPFFLDFEDFGVVGCEDFGVRGCEDFGVGGCEDLTRGGGSEYSPARADETPAQLHRPLNNAMAL